MLNYFNAYLPNAQCPVRCHPPWLPPGEGGVSGGAAERQNLPPRAQRCGGGLSRQQEGPAHPDRLQHRQPGHHLRPQQEDEHLGAGELSKQDDELYRKVSKELDQYAGDTEVFLL